MTTYKIIDALSHPGGTGNEDVYGFHTQGFRLDLWIIDGATSLAEQEYLDQNVSDPAWFAQTLNKYLKSHIGKGPNPPALIRRAIVHTTKLYDKMTAGKDIPLYDKPTGSLVWLRAVGGAGTLDIDMWATGDARALVAARGELHIFPSAPRGDVTKPAADIPASEKRNRTGVLLSHIEHARKDRERYHKDPKIGGLGFHPDSIKHARTHKVNISEDCDIIAVSDGFYRLIDEYSLYTDADLVRAAQTRGLEALYKELRAHEENTEHERGHAIKTRDDATAVHIRVRT